MILCILPTDSTVDITREQRTTAIILLVSVGITVWDRCTHDSQDLLLTFVYQNTVITLTGSVDSKPIEADLCVIWWWSGLVHNKGATYFKEKRHLNIQMERNISEITANNYKGNCQDVLYLQNVLGDLTKGKLAGWPKD